MVVFSGGGSSMVSAPDVFSVVVLKSVHLPDVSCLHNIGSKFLCMSLYLSFSLDSRFVRYQETVCGWASLPGFCYSVSLRKVF